MLNVLNVLICTYLAAKLVRNGLETGLLGLGLIGSFIYAARAEDTLLGPIATITATSAVAATLTLRRERSTAEEGQQPGSTPLPIGGRQSGMKGVRHCLVTLLAVCCWATERRSHYAYTGPGGGATTR